MLGWTSSFVTPGWWDGLVHLYHKGWWDGLVHLDHKGWWDGIVSFISKGWWWDGVVHF